MYQAVQSDNDEAFMSTSASEAEPVHSPIEVHVDDPEEQQQQEEEEQDSSDTTLSRRLARAHVRDSNAPSNEQQRFLFSSASSGDEQSTQRRKRKRRKPNQASPQGETQEQRITVNEMRKRQRRRRRASPERHVPALSSQVPPSAAPAAAAQDDNDPYDDGGIEIMHRDEGWTVERHLEERPDEQESHFKPMILPTRRRLEALLVPGEDPYGPCFACNYHEHSDVGVVGKHWNTMSEMIHKSILTQPPEEVFREAHRYFVETVMTPFIKHCPDDNMRAELEATPVTHIWSPYKVAQHFTQHTIDPLLSTVFDLWDLKAVKELVKSDDLVQQHDQSGRIRVNSKAIDMLIKLRREEDALYGRKIDRMLCANADSRLPEKYAHVHHNRVAVVPFRNQKPYSTHFTIGNH